MSMVKYCDHVWVDRYLSDFDKPGLKVFYECSVCNLRGQAYAIKVSRSEVEIKRRRALENARQLSLAPLRAGLAKVKA